MTYAAVGQALGRSPRRRAFPRRRHAGLFGLGACPPTTLPRGQAQRDPCEIAYKIDLPILGEEEVRLPINQVVNDFWLQMQPKIQELVADVEGEIMREAPDVARAVVNEVVIPAARAEIEMAIAQTEVIAADAIRATVITGLGLSALIIASAWYIKKR